MKQKVIKICTEANEFIINQKDIVMIDKIIFSNIVNIYLRYTGCMSFTFKDTKLCNEFYKTITAHLTIDTAIDLIENVEVNIKAL